MGVNVNFVMLVACCCCCLIINHAEPEVERVAAQEQQRALYSPVVDPLRRRCPLCDSSVYSYCSDKLFHDSCCCADTNNPYYGDRLPYECQYADCGFLHANTCQEHKLISACCCTNYLLK